jgi:uncharacterized membrane protein
MTKIWEPNTDASDATPAPVPKIVNQSRKAVLAFYFGMLGLFTADAILTLFRGAPIGVAVFLWLFRLLPLLIFLPGLRRNILRTYAWLSFVVLMYFTHAVVTAFVPGELFYGLVYSFLCVALFCALLTYIRMAKKHLGVNL